MGIPMYRNLKYIGILNSRGVPMYHRCITSIYGKSYEIAVK